MIPDVIGSVLRCRQAFAQQICERATLDYGIAYFNQTYAMLPEASQFREVVMPPSVEFGEVFDTAWRFFADRGLVLKRWAPAEGRAPARMREGLIHHDFHECVQDVLVLARREPLDKFASVRVLPARAMRAAFTATFPLSDASMSCSATEHDAFVQRLDDPSLDMFVALHEGEPAGRCGLHQVGDIGIVTGFFTKGPMAGMIGAALVSHIVGLALRLNMRLICATVNRGDAWTRELLMARGFDLAGQFVEFDRGKDV